MVLPLANMFVYNGFAVSDKEYISPYFGGKKKMAVSFKDIKMTKREKSLLSILISEIQSCKDMEELKTIIDPWISANDLHPEKVVSLTEVEFKRALLSSNK